MCCVLTRRGHERAIKVDYEELLGSVAWALDKATTIYARAPEMERPRKAKDARKERRSTAPFPREGGESGAEAGAAWARTSCAR